MLPAWRPRLNWTLTSALSSPGKRADLVVLQVIRGCHCQHPRIAWVMHGGTLHRPKDLLPRGKERATPPAFGTGDNEARLPRPTPALRCSAHM